MSSNIKKYPITLSIQRKVNCAVLIILQKNHNVLPLIYLFSDKKCITLFFPPEFTFHQFKTKKI